MVFCRFAHNATRKAIYRLGLACNEQKKHAEAKKFLRYAICLCPTSLTIRDEYNRACKQLKDELLAVGKTWKGAFSRTNKLGDKEEEAKLREASEITQRLEEWEQRKRAQEEKQRTKRTADPTLALKPGTVLTPEQIAARFATAASSKRINYENVARQIPDGPPRIGVRTAAEEAFEKSILGTRGEPGERAGGERDAEDELQEYKANTFAEVQRRRMGLQRQREQAADEEARRARAK